MKLGNREAHGSRFTHQAGNRHKRFVTTLLTLAFDGFKTYISHKADKKLIKGMKIIRKNQKIMNKRITTVENDMLALAQATLHDLNELQNQLENTNARTDYLANRLINAETNLHKVADKTDDNWLAIEYLALVLGQIFPNLERGLSQYEHILHELDVLIDAIDNLSNGLLSPSVIRPGDLQNYDWRIRINIEERISSIHFSSKSGRIILQYSYDKIHVPRKYVRCAYTIVCPTSHPKGFGFISLTNSTSAIPH